MFENREKRVKAQKSYEDFEATLLYCPVCQTATPVRKRLLLVLPDGDKYEYLCSQCSASLGSKLDCKSQLEPIIIKE